MPWKSPTRLHQFDDEDWRLQYTTFAQSCTAEISCVSQENFSKTMLLINKNIIQWEVFEHVTKNNVLHNLAADTG